ncbi:polymeric immunoglobulin receptor [Nothobranchius furzeri]|uniref:Polymeric immunoglobulin receptor n=1 Tax=Nothobranchius furzeri TaxID=105023 RepID=A0A8C6L160_NOTFU|nr:polymeric immunoglobulin receptor [Nothobranchius furzeri]KAF7222900.1 polymeric immunoglobulin receptor-like [Nothobranchius furzeri]
MLQLFKLTLSLLPWIPVFLCRVTTDEEFVVLEGGSLTIPCHYDPQYASYVKYWCQGRTREFCSTLARTDDHRMVDPAEQKVSMFDDPVQQLFTVTMNGLKEEDSGWYMCGVEIGSMWKADATTFTNIKVIHGMSVVNSRMSGEEGSSVTVECLYSERYRESEKKWCRSGDWRSCRSTGSAGSYEDSSVTIRDDRSGAFTVTFKRLQIIDTAWYWCSAGQQKIAVHVLVTQPPTIMSPVAPELLTNESVANLPPSKAISSGSTDIFSGYLLVTISSLTIAVVFTILALYSFGMWKKKERNSSPSEAERMKAKFSGFSGGSASVIFLHNDAQDV